MDTETKVTINFLENNPSGLKKYLTHRYGMYINNILKRLTKILGEQVGIHYTFEDEKNAWNTDLDFYLIKNKLKYPIATAGNKKLPVCFVINPPCYKKPTNDKWIIEDEECYLVLIDNNKKEMKSIYKRKVINVDWKRLFENCLRELNKYVVLNQH